MSNTKTTQVFRASEGKKYQLGRLAMSFKRTDDEDEGSYAKTALIQREKSGCAGASKRCREGAGISIL